MGQLNEDVLRHIVSYLSPETLGAVNTANHVFFDAWMKSRYETLIFDKNDKKTERLLRHLGSESNVAAYVKRLVIRPWLVNTAANHPPGLSLRRSILSNVNEILDLNYHSREQERRLQKCLRNDIKLVVCALEAMQYIKEYAIEGDEEKPYHLQFYNEFFTPMLQRWAGQLTKLTIMVPPQCLNDLASVRLRNLETLEYHFRTGSQSSKDIDDTHNGFLVFVNNLKDSLESISFISTFASINLDITRIYKSLGTFPKLRSISLSAPYNGTHLSDPLVFVHFLEKHRPTLEDISLLTSRCTDHSMPGNPETTNWIQKILASIHTPFPRLRSLALAMRPLRAPLTNVANFLEMHMYTLDSLTLADRAFNPSEFPPFMETSSGFLDLTGLRHFRVKFDNFYPEILYYLASKMPRLISLEIECSSIRSYHSPTDRINSNSGHFIREITDNKSRLVDWKLQRIAIGSYGSQTDRVWASYIEYALVQSMPNLKIISVTY